MAGAAWVWVWGAPASRVGGCGAFVPQRDAAEGTEFWALVAGVAQG